MAILFLGNTKEDVGATINSEDASDVDTFDPQFTTTSIKIPVPNGDAQPFFIELESTPTADMWVHFKWKTPTSNFINDGNADGWIFSIYDVDGAELARFDSINGAPRLLTFGVSLGVSPALFLPNNTEFTFDFKFSRTGGNNSFDWYINQVLAVKTSSAQGTTGDPNNLRFPNRDMSTNAASVIYYSEIIVTADEPTLDWRLQHLIPAADGAETTWNGGFAELLERGDGLSMFTANAGDRQSWTTNAYFGPATSSSIRAVVVKNVVAAGSAGGPQNFEQYLRIGGVNYDAGVTVPDGIAPQYTEWTTNPATGLPWDSADLAVIEYGLLSVA